MKKVTIFSGRALEDELSKIHTVLNNSQADWKQRVENLSMVRALLVAGEWLEGLEREKISHCYC